MVAIINHGANLSGILNYNYDKVKAEKARILEKNRIIENISGDSQKDFYCAIKSFEPYLIANNRTKTPITHISLNPDPKDKLNNKQYIEIAKEYLQEMGFEDQPYIIYKHEDIDRHHIHIVTVRVDENGKRINDSFEHEKSWRICREIEEKYKLHKAIDAKKAVNEVFLKKVNYSQGNIKQQISNTLRSLRTYNFTTFGEYSALLSCFNIHTKFIKGERFGNGYKGIVYSATDDKGNILSSPFKSSLFGKQFGYEKLEKKMETNLQKFKESIYKEKIKPVISTIMQSAKSQTELENKLQEKGIDLILRRNEEGRIYGVTFADHENEMVVNGSKLGKEFSANAINELYHNLPQTYHYEEKIPEDILYEEYDEYQEEIQQIHLSSTLQEIFGIFDFKIYGNEKEEREFHRKLKRKRRRRRRL